MSLCSASLSSVWVGVCAQLPPWHECNTENTCWRLFFFIFHVTKQLVFFAFLPGVTPRHLPTTNPTPQNPEEPWNSADTRELTEDMMLGPGSQADNLSPDFFLFPLLPFLNPWNGISCDVVWPEQHERQGGNTNSSRMEKKIELSEQNKNQTSCCNVTANTLTAADPSPPMPHCLGPAAAALALLRPSPWLTEGGKYRLHRQSSGAGSGGRGGNPKEKRKKKNSKKTQ